MVTTIFVEGHHDFEFFKLLLIKCKDYSELSSCDIWNVNLLMNYLKRNNNLILLRKHNKHVLLIEGQGKHNVTKSFIVSLKEFINFPDNPVQQSLLIIDEDSDSAVKEKTINKIKEYEVTIPDFKTTDPEKYKDLLSIKNTRYSRNIVSAVLDIKPNLENVISVFLKTQVLSGNDRKGNFDEVIQNGIDHFRLNNFDELCEKIFSNNLSDLRQELERICLIDTICNMV